MNTKQNTYAYIKNPNFQEVKFKGRSVFPILGDLKKENKLQWEPCFSLNSTWSWQIVSDKTHLI